MVEIKLSNGVNREWQVRKIGVIGPGIVGMPMAALLANARIKIGVEKPAVVCVVQRKSVNSGWKYEAINKGRSVIGGIEPELDHIVKKNVEEGFLYASSDYSSLSDADVILIAIQTDKVGFAPDYKPLMEGLTELAKTLQNKPANNIPLIIIESTLAPSSMATIIKNHFEDFGLIEGKDILLGNSPNRVMPGRLVERIVKSDKLVAGLNASTSELISHLYKHIVTEGKLYKTNSLTAEVVKTFENAYRDVRIAFSAELLRYCDSKKIDFFWLRDEVNEKIKKMDNATAKPTEVPSGGILVPTVGVGGHCLPKDGILLWWRLIEAGEETKNSIILNSRKINDESPAETIRLMEENYGSLDGKSITILGAAYRFNSEDTRNSPTLQLALLLRKKNCKVIIHDPYVKPFDQNLVKYSLENIFTNDLEVAVSEAEYIIVGTAHSLYIKELMNMLSVAKKLSGVFDACNIYSYRNFRNTFVEYNGLGREIKFPEEYFVEFVIKSFNVMETGVANELFKICEFLNSNYADDEFNKINFSEVRKLAGTCLTGCDIPNYGELPNKMPEYKGFSFSLVKDAYKAKEEKVVSLLVTPLAQSVI